MPVNGGDGYPTGAAAKNLGTSKDEWKKGNDTGVANFAQANRMNHDHYAMGNMHHDKSLDLEGTDAGNAYFEAENAHGVAQQHAYLGGQSYIPGQKQIGRRALVPRPRCRPSEASAPKQKLPG